MLRSLILLIYFISSNGHASEVCSSIKSYKDVIACSVTKSPAVIKTLLETENLKYSPALNPKLFNPEFEFESSRGDGKSETEVSLTQAFDIGGMRSASKKTAETQINESATDLKILKTEIIILTMTKLHRLRQLDLESSALNEIEKAFSKSLMQLKNRPALSPDQQVSISVFQMAFADVKIKETELFEEELLLNQYFKSSVGYSVYEIRNFLPPRMKNFPQIENSKSESLSPNMLKAMASKDVAMAELGEAESGAWPVLNIGPTMKLEKEGAEKNNSFGVRISFEIPIFNNNSAEKGFANQNILKTQKFYEIAKVEADQERETLLKIYNKLIETIKDLPLAEELQRMHQKTASLESRGMINSALLIESLRQRMEIVKGRHGMELKALESLLKIYSIDGLNLEEQI